MNEPVEALQENMHLVAQHVGIERPKQFFLLLLVGREAEFEGLLTHVFAPQYTV